MCIFFLVSASYRPECGTSPSTNRELTQLELQKKYYACWDYRTIASNWCKDYCNTGIPCTGDKRMYYPTEME